MPKLKTSRSAAKRFKLTKHGKVKKKQACTSHILTKKSRNRKRRLRGTSILNPLDTRMVKRLLQYG
ncbi:MAG: 50S ribosomal protein L35 [Candidatus Aureabacteria bacterium]|nr:50S ribosomal protein L35 [Candidatus Auribacterota bacterium]